METRLAVIERNQEEFKGAVVGIQKNLETLVRLEERHAETREALSRAFNECEKLDQRLDDVEKQMPGLVEMRGWVITGMLACLGLVGLAMIGLVINTRDDHLSHVYTAPPAAETRPGPHQ